MNDHFSHLSDSYSKFRPDYPDAFVKHIVSLAPGRDRALDVATGNGQLALKLAAHFHRVDATDISHNQLEQARRTLNVFYHAMPAEQLDFPDATFDLLTVAQAVHWFDFDLFFNEARRVLKPDGIIALVGYSLFRSNPETDALVRDFYENVVGPFWHPERRWIDEGYRTLPFPFEEITMDAFTHEQQRTAAQMLGYIETWSAVSAYKAHHNENPVDRIREAFTDSWNRHDGTVVFPIISRVGKKEGGR